MVGWQIDSGTAAVYTSIVGTIAVVVAYKGNIRIQCCLQIPDLNVRYVSVFVFENLTLDDNVVVDIVLPQTATTVTSSR